MRRTLEETIEVKKRALREQQVALLEKQRVEYAKMQAKFSAKGVKDESDKLLEKLGDIDDQIKSLQADLSHQRSDTSTKRLVSEEVIDGDDILKKYSSTAAFERYKKAARIDNKA